MLLCSRNFTYCYSIFYLEMWIQYISSYQSPESRLLYFLFPRLVCLKFGSSNLRYNIQVQSVLLGRSCLKQCGSTVLSCVKQGLWQGLEVLSGLVCLMIHDPWFCTKAWTRIMKTPLQYHNTSMCHQLQRSKATRVERLQHGDLGGKCVNRHIILIITQCTQYPCFLSLG
jgi:hypothetical protein